MKSPYAAYMGESALSPAEATLLLEVVDEFREWICWKYGDKIRDVTFRSDRGLMSRPI